MRIDHVNDFGVARISQARTDRRCSVMASDEQASRTLAMHLEVLAVGWVCGFAAGAGLLAMILR